MIVALGFVGYIVGCVLTACIVGRATIGDDEGTVFVSVIWPVLWFTALMFWAADIGKRHR